MSGAFDHQVAELADVPAARLADPDGLAALVVAAASAIGIAAPGPPVVRRGPLGYSVAMLCLDGHIVLHASPHTGTCLVDIVVRTPASAAKGLDVITRRLQL